MKLKFFLPLIISLLSIGGLYAQLSDSATISILTVRQGDSLDNAFGHTAIWVVDPITKKSEIYNFGIFDFEEPGFLMKFLRGKLLYSLGINSKKNFFNTYDSQKRTILEQKLNLSTQERNDIYLSIRENYKKENREYLYDFFFDNCSTRPRDLLYNNLPNLSEANSEKPTKTFRHLIDEYVYARPWMDFGIDLIIGKKADKIASIKDQMYLPEYFYGKLNSLTIDSRPIVSSSEIILDYEEESLRRKQTFWLTPALVFGLLLLLELLLFIKYRNKPKPTWLKSYDRLWYTLVSVSSLIILFMWFGTDHIATGDNLNVLWLNPLFILLIFARIRWGQIILSFSLVAALVVAGTIQQIHVASIIIICLLLIKLCRELFLDVPKNNSY